LSSARIMRNKQFLLWMTKPAIRARDAKRGLNIIADELQENALREGRSLSRNQALSQARNEFGVGIKGELGLASMTIREALAREARFLGISMPLASVMDSETRANLSEATDQAQNVISPLISQVGGEMEEAGQILRRQEMNPLRQVEQNKLLGVPVGQ